MIMIWAITVTFQSAIESKSVQSKAEKIGYLDNGQIKVGVDLELGGAITFLAKSKGGSNMINSYDWGRQVQMSHYSGPNPFEPNGKKPSKDWAILGWNPIQSGDCFGHKSKLLDYKNTGKSIYVKCIPMQWPLENEPGECFFECWITLDGITANIRSRVTNNRSDKTQYPGRDQELPAIYTNGPWHRLITYTGNKPFTNDKLTQIPSVFPWKRWQSSENWAALLNEESEGLGVFQEGVTSFAGGFAGKPGSGGPTDFATGYIAPLRQEILDHNIVYEYRYSLIVGNLESIRRWVYSHSKPKSSSVSQFSFQKDRQHWWYVNARDTGWPIKNELFISLDEKDPQILSPTGFWPAESFPKIEFEAAVFSNQTVGQVFWSRLDSQGFTAEKSLALNVIPDGKYRKYTLDLSKSTHYRGIINAFRYDPVSGGQSGSSVRIRSVRLLK